MQAAEVPGPAPTARRPNVACTKCGRPRRRPYVGGSSVTVPSIRHEVHEEATWDLPAPLTLHEEGHSAFAVDDAVVVGRARYIIGRITTRR
jgi:hypothetical protein